MSRNRVVLVISPPYKLGEEGLSSKIARLFEGTDIELEETHILKEDEIFQIVSAAAGESEIAEEETAIAILKMTPVGIEGTIHEEYLRDVIEAALDNLPGPILGEPVVRRVRILPRGYTWMITPDITG